MNIFRFLYQICLADEKLRICLYVLLSIVLSLFCVNIPLVLQQVIDIALTGQNISKINQLGFKLLLLLSSTYYVYYLCMKNIGYLIQEITTKLRKYFYQNIIFENISLSSHLNKSKVLHHIIQDLSLLEVKLSEFFKFFLIHLFIFILILIFLYQTNKLIFLIFLSYCVLSIILSQYLGNPLIEKNKLSQNNLISLSSKLQDMFLGLQIIKIFGLEKKVTRTLNKLTNNYMLNKKKLLNIEAKILPLNYVAELLGVVTVIWCGAYFILKGQMSASLLIVFLMYAEIIAEPISHLGEYVINFKTIKTLFQRLTPIINHCKKNELTIFGKNNLKEKINDIHLEKISFKYPTQTNYLFKNLSLQIKRGDILGIVGKNGSGKTTILKLLLGFNSPLEGNILVNKKSIYQFNEKSWRKKISLMPQNSHIFNDTLIFNLTLKNHEINFKKLDEIITLVGLQAFIDSLPEAMNTVLNEKNVMLSGGEIQRIALARSLYSNSEILLFDEPCNHLDARFIEDFHKILKTISDEKIIIIIDHRIDFIKKITDKIIYLTPP
jgi:ABC-type multidrug transport system fused ATPase/permease subunit